MPCTTLRQMDAIHVEAGAGLASAVGLEMGICEKRNFVGGGPSGVVALRWDVAPTMSVGLGTRYRFMAYPGSNSSDCWHNLDASSTLLTHEVDLALDLDFDLEGLRPRLALGPTWSIAANGSRVYPQHESSQALETRSRRRGWFVDLGWRFPVGRGLDLLTDVTFVSYVDHDGILVVPTFMLRTRL